LINFKVMKDKKCATCPEYKRCRDSYVSWLFFIIGLVATIAIRMVTVLIQVNPVYGKIAWYTGVCGFFLFFIYKFKVNQTRLRLISQKRLLEKINREEQLSRDDYNLVGAILCSLSSRKETINYFFIFVLSAAALALVIYMDFIK